MVDAARLHLQSDNARPLKLVALVVLDDNVYVVVDKRLLGVQVGDVVDGADRQRRAGLPDSAADGEAHPVERPLVLRETAAAVGGALNGREVVHDPVVHVVLLDGTVEQLELAHTHLVGLLVGSPAQGRARLALKQLDLHPRGSAKKNHDDRVSARVGYCYRVIPFLLLQDGFVETETLEVDVRVKRLPQSYLVRRVADAFTGQDLAQVLRHLGTHVRCSSGAVRGRHRLLAGLAEVEKVVVKRDDFLGGVQSVHQQWQRFAVTVRAGGNAREIEGVARREHNCGYSRQDGDTSKHVCGHCLDGNRVLCLHWKEQRWQ